MGKTERKERIKMPRDSNGEWFNKLNILAQHYGLKPNRVRSLTIDLMDHQNWTAVTRARKVIDTEYRKALHLTRPPYSRV
jgi:hypothetical protein